MHFKGDHALEPRSIARWERGPGGAFRLCHLPGQGIWDELLLFSVPWVSYL